MIETPPVSSPAVRLSGLRKSYGPVRAVNGVDLEIASGEVVAILGPNGAGKSTTVDLLLGLARPDSGTATLFGVDPTRACAAGRVGAMLQSGGLLPDLTVRELVEMMCHLYPRPRPVGEVLDRAGIAEIAARRTTALSGGQAQRVRFALALAPDPDLLVLDEPTAAMDVEARRAFWTSTRAWAAGGGTVLLRDGRVVADGSTAEVKALAGGRTIRATLPLPHLDVGRLESLPGVAAVEVRGRVVTLACPDSDAALRALLAGWPEACDVEVSGAGLEAAFLALTTNTTSGATPEQELTA